MPYPPRSYLKDTHPQLREQFVECITSPELSFDDLGSGVSKKCKWRCSKSTCEHAHEWTASILNRTSHGSGCPFCAHQPRQVCRCYSLGKKYPKLLAEYCLSNERDPFTIPCGSSIKVQWKCSTCAYIWEAAPSTRTSRTQPSNCPACARSVPSAVTNLGVCFPEIAKEFHSTKNAPLTTKTIMPSTKTIIWWFCAKHNYEWQAAVGARTAGNSPGCKYCKESSLEYYMRLVLEKLINMKAIQGFIYDTRLGIDTRLRGDFVLTLLDNRKLVIEMDGPQHFSAIRFGSQSLGLAHEGLQTNRERDQRKKDWCRENNYHLLRIAYTMPKNEYEKTVFGFLAFCQECPEDDSRFAMLHTPHKNQTCDMELDS